MNAAAQTCEPDGLNILIIGINFAPEIISTGVYTTGMAQFLARRGHNVSVVSAHPYYPEWCFRKGWPRLRYVRSALDQAHPSLSVIHCPLYVPGRPTGLRRILHHASFALTSLAPALASALSRARPDVVIVVAPSLLSALTGLIAARVSGAKTWLHIQDFEVEAALATGLLKPGGRLGRLALAFEQFVLKRFNRVSTISAPMLAKLPQKGVAQDRVRELRNWADLDLISPGPVDAKMRATLGITTPHVVLYSGNLANKQGLEILSEVARRLSHRGDITMLICGDGPMRSSLHQACKDLPNVRFAPLQPKERLGALLRAADLHLLPQIAGAADLVLPSKLKNMLASGRPVVATANPGTALADEIGDAGVITAPGDASALALAICELVDDPVRRLAMGQRGGKLVRTRWNPSVILKEFEAQLLELKDPTSS
ncbi:WcaI family glycosyltransferase [Yoonia vestfoldensis]|uniref:Alpha-D-kanosaminyltransferase n=1 Tax=Yoonia vestfoldensis TaxID=245188 RepID=A0A1Y0EC10_9RHOB|nr:WcaI family glycosyltransferase [Yoonia vestfoldensis]ARU00902.1 alpha-D-kanosaminyltransferase [Yoonia vestfoldensis]